MIDKRCPKLEKIGCYYRGSQVHGFEFFDIKTEIEDNDVFVYTQGILWKVKKT